MQALPLDLAKHVLRGDAQRGIGVVRAAGPMDVMITREEAVLLRIDPTRELDGNGRKLRWLDRYLALENTVFRSAAGLHGEGARREEDGLAVVPVDVLLKEEVRREALGLGWVDAALGVLELKARDGWGTIGVANGERHGQRGAHVEQDRHFTTKAEVLRSLADVKGERGFALAVLGMVAAFAAWQAGRRQRPAPVARKVLAGLAVLSLFAWVVFGTLLVGRLAWGWRGVRAVRWTLAGLVLLLLAFFGSKLVLEIILGKGWQS